MRNQQFGIAAGSPNWAQGGTPNRFRFDDELIRRSRGELYGEPMMEVLPSWAPYKWAFGDGLDPEEAIAAGAGESMDRDLWGGFYYGYHPYRDHGYPEAYDDASYTAIAHGYTDPLGDPDQDLWHYAAPSDIQPQVHETQPWHAAFVRQHARGRSHHESRSDQGRNAAYEYESLDFEGRSG